MKFLITVHDFRSVNGYTIAPRHVALGLKAKAKHQVKFLCLHKPRSFYKGENPDDFIEVKPQNLAKSQKIAQYDPDIIITNGNSIVDIIAIEYAKSNKKIAISFVHTRYEKVIEQRYLPWGQHWPQMFINSIAEVLLSQFNQVDAIIALSPEMKGYLIKHFPESKIKVVGNGIDLKQFPFKKRYPQKSEYINLLYVANIEKRKNQTFLIEMMKYLPAKYILHLVGGREEADYYMKFKAALNKYLKQADNIIYYGKIDHRSIAQIYDMAHLFVDSSLMEAQSVVLIEAIASGIPIIRINNDDTSGVTIHKKTAFHVNEPATTEEFAKKLIKLLNDSELYHYISQQQLQARDDFSREKVTNDLVTIIEEVIVKNSSVD